MTLEMNKRRNYSKTLCLLMGLVFSFALLNSRESIADEPTSAKVGVSCGFVSGVVGAFVLDYGYYCIPVGVFAGYALGSIFNAVSESLAPGQLPPSEVELNEVVVECPLNKRKIYTDRRVTVYFAGDEEINEEALVRAKSIAAGLNDSFSEGDSCLICLEEWKDLKSSSSKDFVLVRNSCECKNWYCEGCSNQLLGKSCPTCRGNAFRGGLIFEIASTVDS